MAKHLIVKSLLWTRRDAVALLAKHERTFTSRVLKDRAHLGWSNVRLRERCQLWLDREVYVGVASGVPWGELLVAFA